MKTKIRTFIAICILGFIGVVNVNARNITEEGKNPKNVSVKTEGTVTLVEKVVPLESNLNAVSVQAILDENANTQVDFQKEAQLVTKWVADNEETKTIQKLTDEGKLTENK